MAKVWKFFGLLGGTILLLIVISKTGWLVFQPHQILSVSIFSMFIYGTLLFGDFRLAFAFGGIALLMICNLLSVERFTQAASLDVLIFLIGTFLVIGYLEESRFFEHVVSGVVGAIGPRPQRLLLILMVTASIASALVGEVTAILFMAGAMLHLTNRYRLNPVPFVIMLVFACNTGSAMSSVGNPIGVHIALKAGLSFMDFLKLAASVALVVDVATYFVCRWWFADAFNGFAQAVHAEFAALEAARKPALAMVGAGGSDSSPAVQETADRSENVLGETFYSADVDGPSVNPEARRMFRRCWIILGGLILLLVTHGLTEHLLRLKESTIMGAAALVIGVIVLLLSRGKARELVERRVDWWTLAFFMMLFASVGTLEDTHVTEVIAGRISGSGGSQFATVQLIGWSTGWASAFLDNVLAGAPFMPLVQAHSLKNGGA